MLGCPQAARLFDIPVLSVHGAGFIAHGIRNTHEVKELRRANEILKLASAFFAQAELDRKLKY